MKKIKVRVLIIVSILIIILKLSLISCVKDKAPAPPIITEIVLDSVCPDTVFYQTEIKALIDQNCATSGCHDAATQTQGYDLSTYQNVSANAQIILESMHGVTVQLMPLGNALPAASIQRFDCWIKQGKLEN